LEGHCALAIDTEPTANRQLLNADHENVTTLLNGIKVLTLGLVLNEVDKKTDDAKLENAITQSLGSLYKALD
jgi:hypothetical protein